MLDELRQIDVSAIAELVRIKEEEQILSDRLSKMETSKEKVSAAVYKRVRTDYESRQSALDVQSQPLKDRARREYARLRTLRAEIEKAVEEASLAKEELEFRRDLGEFPGEEFRSRLEDCEKTLAGKRQELAEIDQLKQQFINAFHSEAELDVSAGAASPQPEPARSTIPQGEETVVGNPPAVGKAAARESLLSLSPDATVIATSPMANLPQRETAGPPALGAPAVGPTVKLAMPRIVKVLEDQTTEEYTLRPGTTSIGRSPKNQIALPYSEVSRHHADIVYAADGYRIVDLGSGNGILVNGKRVREHPLADGDLIQIGMRKLIYKS